MFHASLTQAYKTSLQQEFMNINSTLRCLVATVAFGMGMDVPDIELVVVYGVPKSLSELYQLVGRAGRNGCSSKAHLLFSSRQKLKDKTVEAFVKNKENCRRKFWLEGIGGTSGQEGSQRCCDLCTPNVLSGLRLDISKPGPTSRKRKVSHDELDKQLKCSLKSRLQADRAAFLVDNPDFLMIGFSFLCPDSTLTKLCTDALRIRTVDDLIEYGVRTELRDVFFSIIKD